VSTTAQLERICLVILMLLVSGIMN